MLAVTALAVLLGVAALLVIGAQIAEDRINDRVEEVNKDFDASLNRFREEVRRELDARIPQGGTGGIGAVTPTPTPFAQPTAEPTPEGDATATATPTAAPDDAVPEDTVPDDSLPDAELTPEGARP